jgi:Family of unknown function (DUF6492)
MARLAVITKSYAPDFELCAGLHRSVLDYSPNTVHHHIIVPRRDLKLFSKLANSRTHIRCDADFLPQWFVPAPFGNWTVNLTWPIPPVRGWILQQVVKLAATAASDDDVVLVVDSDVEFVRPFSAETFIQDGHVRFYRQPDKIVGQLPRHAIWQRISRVLLGVPASPPPYADYIAAMLAVDPAFVRQMLSRVTATSGRPWPTVIARQVHFSEWTLYGVFVDEVIRGLGTSFASDDSLCLGYWDEIPLNLDEAIRFLSRVGPTHVAAMISAKSRTPLAIRRAAFARRRATETAGRLVVSSG